jgi:hypothetical protein
MPTVQQLVPELARDSNFLLRAMDLDISAGATTGLITAAAGMQDQHLSRQMDGSGVQTAFGHLAEADLMMRFEEENIRAADAVHANWTDIALDWELGLLGVRQIGQSKDLGINDAWVNPLTEIMFEYLQNAWGNPTKKQRRVQCIFTSFDRRFTFTGKISGHTWRYRRAENNDNLVLKCVDIGGPNPLIEVVGS